MTSLFLIQIQGRFLVKYGIILLGLIMGIDKLSQLKKDLIILKQNILLSLGVI